VPKQTDSVIVMAAAYEVEDDPKEVLDERHALVGPRRSQGSEGPRIQNERIIAAHVNVDEVQFVLTVA
jgi:hypothetical protein